MGPHQEFRLKRSMVGAVLAVMVLLAAPQNAPLAQEKQQMAPEQHEMMQMAQNFMPMMMQAMLSTLLDFFSNPIAAEKEAIHARNLYEALVKKGFSKDEALAIVVGYGSPVNLPSNQ